MNQEDKVEPTDPEDSDVEHPICEGCGERHPPMPEGMAGMLDIMIKAMEAQKAQEEEARQNFFTLASISMTELARAVMADPDGAKHRAQAMRDAILVLSGMSEQAETPESPEEAFNIGQVMQ